MNARRRGSSRIHKSARSTSSRLSFVIRDCYIIRVPRTPVHTVTEHPPISAGPCEWCDEIAEAWKDFELVRRVLRDPRLKPASLYREVARRIVAPKKLSGRGVGPRVRREVDEWFRANRQHFPGLAFRGGRNAPAKRISAIDLSLLLGYARLGLDHAYEVCWLKRTNRHKPQTCSLAALPLAVRKVLTLERLNCPEDEWSRRCASLARTVVARELKISARTISRRLEADPHSKDPSIWAWAAHYHLHSLRPNPLNLRPGDKAHALCQA